MLPVAGAVAHAARAVRALAAPRAAHGAVDARVAVPHGAPARARLRPALPRHAHRYDATLHYIYVRREYFYVYMSIL